MIKQIATTFIVFLLLDGIWLSIIAKKFYSEQLGFLLSKSPNLLAAGIFYLIYCSALTVLVITPAVQKESLQSAILTGALLGLCAYAAYDLTNLATIKDWPILVTVVDMLWGTFLSASVAGMSYVIITKWL